MAYFLILAAIVLRFLPHLPNFAPISAIAIFSAVYLPKKWAFVVPILAMLVSDVFIGLYSFPIMVSVYGSFSVSALLGLWLKERKGVVNTVGVVLAASLQFYLITNFAVWAFGTLYPHTSAGLLASYVNALPFLRGTLLGDLFYVGAMFGLYEAVRRVLPSLERGYKEHKKLG